MLTRASYDLVAEGKLGAVPAEFFRWALQQFSSSEGTDFWPAQATMAAGFAVSSGRDRSYCDRQVRRWLTALGPPERGGCGLLEWCHQRPRLKDGVVCWRQNVYRPTLPPGVSEEVARAQAAARRRGKGRNSPGRGVNQTGGGGAAGGQRVLSPEELAASQRAAERAAGLDRADGGPDSGPQAEGGGGGLGGVRLAWQRARRGTGPP